MEPRPLIFDPKPITVVFATLLCAATIAGCIEAPEENGDANPGPNGNADPANETLVPDPLVIEGSAMAFNPAHPFFCTRGGFDGELHELERDVDGWRFSLDPPEALAAYWYNDDEYLEGGTDTGNVPTGSTHVEVCNMNHLGPTEYTMTIIHADHPDA